MKNENNSGADKCSEAESEVLINTGDMAVGFYLCLNNSEKFLKISKQLLNSKDYQASIPIATISIEEAMKGLEIVIKFSKNQGITADDWDRLMSHKHKLTNVLQWAIDNLKSRSEDDLNKTKDELSKTGLKYEGSLDAGIRRLERSLAAYGHFQKLREICFYSNWDKQNSKWTIFDELAEEKQEALAFFIVTEAQIRLNFLRRFIEKYVNRHRKNGHLLTKVPYPSYEDYKPPEDWESNSLHTYPQSKIEQIKYEKGFEIMKWFININSFQFASSIFRKSMLEYLRLIARRKVPELFPHPMIDAMITAAFMASTSSVKDKPVMATSGDSDQTYNGKPAIVFAAIAKMDSDTCNFVEVRSLFPYPESKLTQDMIERIIRTETVIERCSGKTIPMNLCIEALSVIGIKCKMIKQNEISVAIRVTKEAIQQGFVECPNEIARQVCAIKGVEEWDDIGSILRSAIASIYGPKKYSGYDIYLTPIPNMPKFECRRLVLNLLNNKHFPTA